MHLKTGKIIEGISAEWKTAGGENGLHLILVMMTDVSQVEIPKHSINYIKRMF